jgi:hypothetical protein
MVQLKSTVVAGPERTSTQAQLIPVATIKTFLAANKVEMPASTQTIVGSATRSVVRVICARR